MRGKWAVPLLDVRRKRRRRACVVGGREKLEVGGRRRSRWTASEKVERSAGIPDVAEQWITLVDDSLEM